MDVDPRENSWRTETSVAARRSVQSLIKTRARHYSRRPGALEALHPGLSMAEPTTLVAIAEHLVERERRSPRRWFGFGGEVGLVNAKAALLLGRAQRRREPIEDRQPVRPRKHPGAEP